MITQEQLKELFSYDPDTGIFTRRVSLGGWKAGGVAGCCSTNANGKSYERIHIDGKNYLAHRLAWLFAYGEFPVNEIDHVNGDGADNRLTNLRSVNHSENGKNSRLHSSNTSGVCGVYWNKAARKWLARIKVNSKFEHLGSFTDKSDAIAARKSAEIKYGFHINHGEIRPL